MKRLILLTAMAIMANGCSRSETLVAYFSATGTTKAVAERIAAAAAADLFEIAPAQPYTDADLNWRDSLSRSSVEMRDKASRPAVARKVRGIERYRTVFIGFPIWWYTAPTIINTFIEENDLSGARVKLFATSGSSDIRGAVKHLKAAYPGINWLGGTLLNNATDDAIERFVQITEPAPSEQPEQPEQLCGGYSEQREPTEEEVALFRSVTGEGDIVFTPLSVATQVVAGLNYKFWCRFENTGQASGHCWVTIFKPLQGAPTLTKIENVE